MVNARSEGKMAEIYKVVVSGHDKIRELSFVHCPRIGETVVIDSLGSNARFMVRQITHHAYAPGANHVPNATITLEPHPW
jgi:hypothetical protein